MITYLHTKPTKSGRTLLPYGTEFSILPSGENYSHTSCLQTLIFVRRT